MMADKMMKKTLAMLLTGVMVFSATQMTAFAGNSKEMELPPVVEIPVIPVRPVIPENPVRPNIPDVPVIEVEIEDEADDEADVEIDVPKIPAEGRDNEIVDEAEGEDEADIVKEDEGEAEDDGRERPERPRYEPEEEEDLPPVEEIPEEDVPLTDIPVEQPAEEPVEQPVEEIVEEIFEEEVPLADVPATGDGMMLYTALTLISGTGLAWLGLKKQD